MGQAAAALARPAEADPLVFLRRARARPADHLLLLLAGLLLFFNVSSYLLQSRVRTLIDQANFIAQSVVLEAEHGDSADVLRRRLETRLRVAADRFPFTVDDDCAGAGPRLFSDLVRWLTARRRGRSGSVRGSTCQRPNDCRHGFAATVSPA